MDLGWGGPGDKASHNLGHNFNPTSHTNLTNPMHILLTVPHAWSTESNLRWVWLDVWYGKCMHGVVWVSFVWILQVISNRWTGLWTGSLDWTAGVGVTFELKLCVSHVQCLAASRLPRSRTQHAATMGVLCLRDLKGMQQMEQFGRPIGTIIYSKASHWPSIVFTWLHSTRLRVLHSLVTSVGFNLTAAFSMTLQQYIVLVKRHLSEFLMLFCTLDIVRGCFAELMHFV